MKTLKYEFKDKELIRRALTHRSALNERSLELEKHNERLEFLGDAVLELIITEYLFEHYPERPEGELTSFRAAVVRTESLAETASKLGFGVHLIMSRGEEATGGRERPYILANAFEAVLGAMYLDGGYDACKQFVERELAPKLPDIVEKRLDIDPKSKLQELAQEKYKITPTYEVMKEYGPDHDKIFTMQAKLGEKVLAQGEGKSKQEAEQAAAAKAFEKIML
ncbi:MAG: ribonuclease III [Candidatus Dojkabacteria bacterium]